MLIKQCNKCFKRHDVSVIQCTCWNQELTVIEVIDVKNKIYECQRDFAVINFDYAKYVSVEQLNKDTEQLKALIGELVKGSKSLNHNVKERLRARYCIVQLRLMVYKGEL